MLKTRDIPMTTQNLPRTDTRSNPEPAAPLAATVFETCLEQAQAMLTKLLDDKRSLSWIQFATD
jgi:hypothetical protein